MKFNSIFTRVLPDVMVSSAICGLLVFLTGCSENNSGSSSAGDSKPVITAGAVWEHEMTRVESVGTSRARHTVTLFPAVAGEVVAVNIRANQYIEAGEVLLQLDDRDEKLAVELARVELADAQRQLDRYRRTKDSGAVTVSTLDDAKSAVDRARIALNRAEVALDHRSIEAPFSGHVGLTSLDSGARVDPATEITTLDDRSVLLVTFELPEIVLGQLQEEQMIVLTTWMDNNNEIPGRVVDIDSQVDARSRTFTVRAHVDNTGDRLRPGMSFRVVLTLKGGRYPVVPESALQWGGDGAYVWAVREGQATRVAATIVQRRDGKILLDAKLPEGIPVVVEGVQRMREGQTVHELNENNSQPVAPPATSNPA
jgi:RND family efflux transporter MFP subunit